MRLLLSVALALPLAALADAARPRRAGELLRLEPREGLVLEKRFESTMELELVESREELTVGGEDHPTSSDEMEATIRMQSTLLFVDEITSAREGRIEELTRTFEELTEDYTFVFESEDDEDTQNETGESDLEGQRVTFAWDADAGAYEASFADGSDGDSALLERLEGELDLLPLLPEGEVELGATWPIDVARWRSVDRPSGDLKIQTPSDDGSERESDEAFYDNLHGELEARFEAVVERDGRRLAHVHVEGSLSSTFERDPETASADEMGFEGEVATTTTTEVDVVADLYWDLDAGRAATFRSESQIRYTLEVTNSGEAGGTEFEHTSVQVFEGPSITEATFEPRE